MRTGAAAGHHGYFHEAVCYDSDEHFLAVVQPFIAGGIEAGEPTVVALGERTAGLLRDTLPADAPVNYVAGGRTYASPAGAIRSYRRMLGDHVAAGAGQIRIVGEIPEPSLGPAWDWWARYESAINHAYDEFPLWSMCAYDARICSPAVLADVARTHPRTALPGDRHEPGPAYVDPRVFLLERRPLPPDPIQAAAPKVDLTDPAPGEARRAIRAAAPADLDGERLDDFVVAVSETVTNAHRHGLPPARMRIWTGAGRTIVEVTDGGGGPKNPFAGLLPVNQSGSGGLGLWITHQACDYVAFGSDDDGFTIRLVARDLG